jgi:LSD1 subclass zinc finger protein
MPAPRLTLRKVRGGWEVRCSTCGPITAAPLPKDMARAVMAAHAADAHIQP